MPGSVFGALTEWADMLTDVFEVDREVGKDRWGNPIDTTTTSTNGLIINRRKGGGSETPSDRQHENYWVIVAVFPDTTPSPSVNEVIRINGKPWQIDSLIIHEDVEGKVCEVTCHNLEAEVQP